MLQGGSFIGIWISIGFSDPDRGFRAWNRDEADYNVRPETVGPDGGHALGCEPEVEVGQARLDEDGAVIFEVLGKTTVRFTRS